jgi:hypothetical protein
MSAARSLPLVAAMVLACAAGAHAAENELVFHVEQNGGIRLTLSGGAPVGSTPISPGTYAVIVRNPYKDEEGRPHLLYLTGPGVQLIADANQGEQDDTTWTFAFAPSATYTWADGLNPGVSGVFRTAAVAAPPTVAGASAGGSSGGGSGGSSKSGASVVAAVVGPVRGTLRGKIDRKGKLMLAFNGKPVSSLRLKAGNYRVVVVDQTRTGAFNLQAVGKPGRTITGLPFVGTRSVTLELAPGRWTYFSTISRQLRFVVA